MTSAPSSVMPPGSTLSPVPWMPPRTSGCSQKCSAECHSPAPMSPVFEPLALTLLFFQSLSPITSYLSSLCFIFHCSLPLMHEAQRHLQDLHSSLSTSIHHAPDTCLLFLLLQTPFCWYFCLFSTEKAMTMHSGKIWEIISSQSNWDSVTAIIGTFFKNKAKPFTSMQESSLSVHAFGLNNNIHLCVLDEHFFLFNYIKKHNWFEYNTTFHKWC